MMLEAFWSFAESVKRAPRWAVLRLAAVSGVNAGWWIMAIVSAVVGGLMAVLCVTMVHHYLKGGEPAITVQAEEEGDKQGVQEDA